MKLASGAHRRAFSGKPGAIAFPFACPATCGLALLDLTGAETLELIPIAPDVINVSASAVALVLLLAPTPVAPEAGALIESHIDLVAVGGGIVLPNDDLEVLVTYEGTPDHLTSDRPELARDSRA